MICSSVNRFRFISASFYHDVPPSESDGFWPGFSNYVSLDGEKENSMKASKFSEAQVAFFLK